MARVRVTTEAMAQIESIKLPERRQIEKAVVALERWPDVSGVKALSGDLAGRFRNRAGAYRVVFTVQGKGANAEVVVIKVAIRRDVYE